ncbi:hypothetical protein D3C87_598540 [compost metagenome]
MRQTTKDLCWMGHRAECDAAHDQAQTTGIFHDIRGEQQIPVTEETIAIYNLGVGAGVKATLGQLGHEGYKIFDSEGRAVVRIDDEGKPQNYDVAFTQWLTDPESASSRDMVRTMPRVGGYVTDPGDEPVDEEEPMD